jgi:hypothetical protein
MIKKIISGGQTGVNQAALDAARKLNIAHGGWIPKGRKTENGPLPVKYNLKELGTTNYPKRTEQNIFDSDGTLIITFGKLTGGSELACKLAQLHGFPCLHVDLNTTTPAEAARRIRAWLDENKIRVLNVAGSRASKAPAIYQKTVQILKSVLNEK